MIGLCKELQRYAKIELLSSSPWRIGHRVPRSLHRASPLPDLGLPVLQGTHDLFCCREDSVICRMFLQMVDSGLLGNLAVLGVLELVPGTGCEIGIGIFGFTDRGWHGNHVKNLTPECFGLFLRRVVACPFPIPYGGRPSLVCTYPYTRFSACFVAFFPFALTMFSPHLCNILQNLVPIFLQNRGFAKTRSIILRSAIYRARPGMVAVPDRDRALVALAWRDFNHMSANSWHK